MHTSRDLAARLLLVLALFSCAARASTDACSDAAREGGWTPPAVSDTRGARMALDDLIDVLATRRVVFVGEVHDRYDHHLNQLEIICRLAARGPLAIGVEFFQTPAQAALDAYVSQHGDLERLLRESEWFERWRYDPRLYAPILRFARERRIALVALNVPGELVRRVARQGMDALGAAERARLPAVIHAPPAAYRERLRRVFEQHPGHETARFEHFVQAQQLWDEGMAQRAAEHLLEHPGQRLVVLAGEGHIAYRDPIPDRLARRVDAPRALVLQSHPHAAGDDASDFRLISTPHALPPAGRMGVTLADDAEGVRVTGFASGSAARDAGMREGDRLTAVGQRAVRRFADVRLALWRLAPGDPVRVAVVREGVTRLLGFNLR